MTQEFRPERIRLKSRPTEYPINNVYGQVEESLKRLGIKNIPTIEGVPDGKEGDFGFPCFEIAKQAHTSPNDAAISIANKFNLNLQGDGYISKFITKGAYVNLEINYDRFGVDVISKVFKDGNKYGAENLGQGRIIVIDFSAPNIAKRMTIGHLRSTIIGDSLSKILSFEGYKVTRDNHIGDWGTQFGHLVNAVELWGDMAKIQKDPLNELQKLYERINTAIENDEGMRQAGQEKFRQLEDGNPKVRELWKKMVDWSLKDFQKIYDVLGVEFDITRGESYYEGQLKKTIERVKKTIGKESNGALIIDFTDQKLGAQIVQKSDGASLYFTRELATGIHRFDQMKADGIIYVVGGDQEFYFKQFFESMKKLGYNMDKSKHVYFGMITTPEGKLSTRKGRIILLEEVLEKIFEKTNEVVIAKTRINPRDRDMLTKQVAVGALKWFDLSSDPKRSIVFDWDQVLNMDSNSGPYVQYTHARICSILEKSGQVEFPNNLMIKEQGEKELVKLIAKFPSVVKESAKEYAPYKIANYLNVLCQSFNNFYQKHQILGSEDVNTSRVLLTSSVAQVIKNGLNLLGIEAPVKM